MGGLGGMFGLNGGYNGTGAGGPVSANTVNPTNQNQINQSYTGTQGALTSQQQLLQALQGQNALGNQNQVYGQLQGIANGTGPNPAQAMLNQATGQNVATQAALMAGQRGAGQNVGLMARQAAQQGAATQQQAVGQGATLQANQSLNAIGQAGQMANTQAGQLTSQANANAASQLGQQSNLLGAQAAYNNAQVGMQSNINSANAGLAASTQGIMASALGGLSQGAGSALVKGAANGGQVPDYAQGGQVAPIIQTMPTGPQSNFAKYLLQGSTGQQNMMAKGGEVKALVSPGEVLIPPEKVGKALNSREPLKEGKKVPGKPKYPGNDYRNDVVPAKLKSGGIVIPNEIIQSGNPEQEEHKFISAVIAKRKVK
jgi:hypothetical protein